MTRMQILVAYGAPLILATFVALMSVMSGDPATVVFHKILVVPLFLLAARGLRAQFPERLDRQRKLGAFAEYHLLDGALLAAFLTLVTSWGGVSLTRQIVSFVVVTLMIAGLRMAMLWFSRRATNGVGR